MQGMAQRFSMDIAGASDHIGATSCHQCHAVLSCVLLYCAVPCCAAQGMAERFSTDIAGACERISALPETVRPKVRAHVAR